MSYALLTDLYELTMMQGYFLQKNNPDVVFDMFFRRQPFGGGFSVFAGLNDLIDEIEELRFEDDDISYLESLGQFRPEFLKFLKNFVFTGDMYAMDEGSLAFPGEPLIRVHAPLIEAQLLESMLLNIVNFQTLIATKAARIYLASNAGNVLEFGLRRAQGIDGALSAARASYIGGVSGTSNTLAGKRYGIPVRGTMAHSWIMAFESEEAAFRKYIEIYPDSPVLLIDTYDTLGSGIQSAITVGLELKQQGRSFGVRLDSGDLQYLSKEVRRQLDDAGLEDAVIAVSNELTEEIIHQLVTEGAPIDFWGVGTHLVTGGRDSALTGVYKLAAKEVDGAMTPTIKISNNPGKVSNPGIKQVLRFFDDAGYALADLLTIDGEEYSQDDPVTFYHPDYVYEHFKLSRYATYESLLKPCLKAGKRIGKKKPLADIRAFVMEELDSLDGTFKRIINPHIYKVSLSKQLRSLKSEMIDVFEDQEGS